MYCEAESACGSGCEVSCGAPPRGLCKAPHDPGFCWKQFVRGPFVVVVGERAGVHGRLCGAGGTTAVEGEVRDVAVAMRRLLHQAAH